MPFAPLIASTPSSPAMGSGWHSVLSALKIGKRQVLAAVFLCEYDLKTVCFHYCAMSIPFQLWKCTNLYNNCWLSWEIPFSLFLSTTTKDILWGKKLPDWWRHRIYHLRQSAIENRIHLAYPPSFDYNTVLFARSLLNVCRSNRIINRKENELYHFIMMIWMWFTHEWIAFKDLILNIIISTFVFVAAQSNIIISKWIFSLQCCVQFMSFRSVLQDPSYPSSQLLSIFIHCKVPTCPALPPTVTYTPSHRTQRQHQHILLQRRQHPRQQHLPISQQQHRAYGDTANGSW